jgi:hypothetical protein
LFEPTSTTTTTTTKVLPTLNNLLENREMALDDGRFLMRDTAYDALVESGAIANNNNNNNGEGGGGGGSGNGAGAEASSSAGGRGLCRVHPNFRVVALGLPTPPFPGHSLDPPLRSRFQARVVGAAPAGSVLETLQRAAPELDAGEEKKKQQLWSPRFLLLLIATCVACIGGKLILFSPSSCMRMTTTLAGIARKLGIVAESVRLLENNVRGLDGGRASAAGGGGGGGSSVSKALFPSFPHWYIVIP